MQQTVADISTREFVDLTADPDVFCGGGSVAAVTAAGAAATALLVLRLNVKRRANAGVRDEIQAAIVTTETVIDDFLAAADDDISILAELLAAQRALKSGGSQADYLTALTNAADSPLRMAERIARFLDVVEAQLPISSRFTVSDLGAAAVLAEGAGRAALLTAEVNIALLNEAEGSDPAVVRRLDRQREELRSKLVKRSIAIEESTRKIMLGSKSDGTTHDR
jgi:formiminotetrahydrofolate cyclodeaminase